MPADDLKKLAATFDTVKDPILAMKICSVKRGVEGAIALAQSHGEEVDWENVSSSRAHSLSELMGFFEKAKSMRQASCRLSLRQRLLRLPHRPLRLLRQVLRCLRQALVLPLPHLLPPGSLLLRWRRFSLSL
jgi:hypothetical protein